MTEDDPTDEISDIEARIERLAEIAERCRKYILASKIAIGGGAALLLITILGLLGIGQTAALGSIALVLGGIVSLGSNISTLRQTDERHPRCGGASRATDRQDRPSRGRGHADEVGVR